MSTIKTLDEVMTVLSRLRFNQMHDYQRHDTKISGLGLKDSVLPLVMREIGPGWKSVELRSIPAAGDTGQWLRVDIVREERHATP